MGIEDVHPREPSTTLAIYPGPRGRDDGGRRTLRNGEIGRERALLEVVVVEVEPDVEPELRMQRESAHERSGSYPLRLEHCRECWQRRGKAKAAVIVNAVLERVQTRQDAGV